MDPAEGSVQDRLRHMIEWSCRTLKSECEALGQQIRLVRLGRPSATAATEQAQRLARDITGLGASGGFGDVSLRASALAGLLQKLVDEKRRPDSAEEARIVECFEKLQATAASLTPQASRLYDADLNRVGLPSRDRRVFRT